MGEIIKEFIFAVIGAAGEEINRAGSGIAVCVMCFVAFSCIMAGIFIESRCGVLYYITAEGKERLVGSVYFRSENAGFKMKIPEHFFEKSESVYYCIKVPKDFAHRHYMEELQLELPTGKKKFAIKKQIKFKQGWK